MASKTLESLRQAIASLQPFEAEGLIVAGKTDEYFVTDLGRLFLRNLAMPFDQYLPKQSGVNFSRTI
jgi:coproporphyrinogen III oxidase-like Fe-S oxidoreductase